jgi:hypothetical protein
LGIPESQEIATTFLPRFAANFARSSIPMPLSILILYRIPRSGHKLRIVLLDRIGGIGQHLCDFVDADATS